MSLTKRHRNWKHVTSTTRTPSVTWVTAFYGNTPIDIFPVVILFGEDYKKANFPLFQPRDLSL